MDKKKYVDIGGQAVMEGVMMKGPDAIGIAVRRKNGDILVSYEKTAAKKENKFLKLPFIRGIVNFGSMMAMGMRVLEKSTNMLGVVDEEPSKFEKWISKTFGKSIEKVVMAVAMLLAVLFSVLLFFMIPEGFAVLLRRANMSHALVNLISGLLRILILMSYMLVISFVPDIRRTFMYHGAEHKTVYCHENNLELTPENAQSFSRLHPRCGTSFILIVFIISIVLFTLVGYQGHNYLIRLLSRLALLPIVAGISYEVLKGLAHSNSRLAKILRYPGLQLQNLTTREPDDRMLECAIVAMNTALYGLPKHAEKDSNGYSILKDYRESDPDYVPTAAASDESSVNEAP